MISDEDNERRDRERRRKDELDHSQSRYYKGDHQRDQAVSPRNMFSSLREDTDSSSDEEVKVHVECETARIEATREAMNGDGGTFVPECDIHGQYSPVQCYKSEGYCWCVDTVSGRPIPGSSSRNKTPSCGVTKGQSHGQVTWRKCEGQRREEFLIKLFDWMTQSVANTSVSSVPYLLNSEPHLTLNQRLAKWQFIALDVNRNGVSHLLRNRYFIQKLYSAQF